MGTYVSRGSETKEAADPSAGTCTSIIESVLSTPSGSPVLYSACCSGVRPLRESIPTSSRFISAPAWPLPLTSELPVLGIASVRLRLASGNRARYHPQPLPASSSTLSTPHTSRVSVATRGRRRPPDWPASPVPPAPEEEGLDPPRGSRPSRGSSRPGSGGRSGPVIPAPPLG